MNIVRSKVAPNPKEVKYWADLTADKYGKIIKIFDGKQWVPLSAEGGGSGTSNYNDLKNKPSINGVTLMGNVALNTLDIQAASEMDKYAEDTEVASLIPDNYVTETELADVTYSKEEIADIVSNVEGSNAWNDVQ